MSHHNDHLARYGKVKKLYCGRRHNMPPPRPPSWQYLCFYSPAGTCSGMLAIKTSATSWPFDLESGVWVTCNVGYLCANFSLPKPLCSRLRPDVPYATDVKQHHRFMLPTGRGITNTSKWCTLTMFTEAYNITPYLQFPGAWPRTTSGTAPGSAGPDPLVFHYTPGPYHCILDKSLCGVNKVKAYTASS